MRSVVSIQSQDRPIFVEVVFFLDCSNYLPLRNKTSTVIFE